MKLWNMQSDKELYRTLDVWMWSQQTKLPKTPKNVLPYSKCTVFANSCRFFWVQNKMCSIFQVVVFWRQYQWLWKTSISFVIIFVLIFTFIYICIYRYTYAYIVSIPKSEARPTRRRGLQRGREWWSFDCTFRVRGAEGPWNQNESNYFHLFKNSKISSTSR